MRPVLLYIDDDEEDIEVFLDAVQHCPEPLTCLIAKDGEQAISLLKASGRLLPDIIFLDINMPRMDGKQCLQVIKEDPRIAKIPVIIYSTTNNPREATELIALGAQRCIAKYSSFKDLCNELTHVISSLAPA